jgi:DNA-binding MarR family transcriptional regulator
MSTGLVHALRGAGHELTTEGWSLLSLLAENDELSQLEIGERVGKDRHHTSRLIDALEQQGLVVRRSTTDDRRVKLISVTDKGRAVRRKLIRVVLAYLDGVFEGVSRRDFDAFIRVLWHITDRLPTRNHQGNAEPGPVAPLTVRARRSGSRRNQAKP